MRPRYSLPVSIVLLVLSSLFLEGPFVNAQGLGGGGFGGGGSGGGGASSSQNNSEAFQFDSNWDRGSGGMIIHGSAVIQVVPEKVRVVLAVMSEAEKPKDCHAKNVAAVKKVRTAWRELEINDDEVVEDFIAMLPRYEWFFEKQVVKLTGIENILLDDEDTRDEIRPDFEKLAVMRMTGHRMQTNLHLEAETEADAMKAIDAALANGVKDVIAFDYWSSKTDDVRLEAMAQALAKAKSKSTILFEVFGEEKPTVIDVSEHTEVVQPSRQYETFENSLKQEHNGNWSSYREVRAYPPKQTFYRGVVANVDSQASSLPMKPSIIVTSKVTIQYRPRTVRKKVVTHE